MAPSSIIKHSPYRHFLAQKVATGGNTSIAESLHSDHLKVADMFFQYEQLEENKEKHTLVQNIMRELFIHTAIEEALVYPAVRKEAGDQEETESLMDEAETEHHMVKVLMLELLDMEPDDEFYDAKVCVLGELVRHHVREEEKYMFEIMKEADIDLEKLSQKCIIRKEELLAISHKEIADMLDEQLQEQNHKRRKKYSFPTTAGR